MNGGNGDIMELGLGMEAGIQGGPLNLEGFGLGGMEGMMVGGLDEGLMNLYGAANNGGNGNGNDQEMMSMQH